MATIVRNEAFRQHTRIRPEPVAMVDVQEGADDERVVATVDRVDMTAALKRLDEADRELLLLRYGEDMTQPAIARLLEIPEGTVKVRLHRAREKLRRAFGNP